MRRGNSFNCFFFFPLIKISWVVETFVVFFRNRIILRLSFNFYFLVIINHVISWLIIFTLVEMNERSFFEVFKNRSSKLSWNFFFFFFQFSSPRFKPRLSFKSASLYPSLYITNVIARRGKLLKIYTWRNITI